MTMQKKVITGCLAVAMLLSVSSLTMAEDMPGPDGDALWNYISKVSPYAKWSFWPDHKGMQDGRAPHGPQHSTAYYSGSLAGIEWMAGL